MLAIARPARERARLDPEVMEKIIAELCQGRYLTPAELGELLAWESVGLQQNYLRGVVRKGLLALRHPDNPTHRDQAYTATTGEDRR